MNHAYRVVWNRAMRCLQVASELTAVAGPGRAARAIGGRCGRRGPLAVALAAALGLGVMAAPAVAGTCTVTITTPQTGTTAPDVTAPGSNGGDGGVGYTTPAGGAKVCLDPSSVVNGGSGGTARFLAGNDNGGNGGAGVVVSASGGLVNMGVINAGSAGDALDASGSGGKGAAGVLFKGAGTLINTGNIRGGYGGTSEIIGKAGVGGSGVVAVGNDSIVTSGFIAGRVGGDGVTRAPAIALTGGNNILTLESGYRFVGNVTSAGGDTLELGGDVSPNVAFDLSDVVTASPFRVDPNTTYYVGFSVLAKTGASMWKVTGSSSTSAPWQVLGGVLELTAGAIPGTGVIMVSNASGLGSTLKVDKGASLGHVVTLRNGGAVDNAGVLANTTGPAPLVIQSGGGTVSNHDGGIIRSGSSFAVYATGGGTVINQGPGSAIINPVAGGIAVRMHGASGAVTNEGGATISGAASAVTLDQGGNVSNMGDGSVISDSVPGGNAVDISGASGSVTNDGGGIISGHLDAVYMADGGSVSNQGSGSMLTASDPNSAGIRIDGAAGTVTNGAGGSISGVINSVNLTAGGSVSNQGVGSTLTASDSNSAAVRIDGAPGTVTNGDGGSISGAINGVLLIAGGEVTNQGKASQIKSTGANGTTVLISGGAGSVHNSGGATIVGTGGDSFGVALGNGGSVVNDSGSLIAVTDGGDAVALLVNGTVTNDGAHSAISASGSGAAGYLGGEDGVDLEGGGTVTNTHGALISGTGAGVVLLVGGTITNGAGSTIEDTAGAPGDCWDTGSCAIYAADASHSTKALPTGGSTTLTNAGTIKGNVQLDSGAVNEVTLNTSGSIDGNLDMGTATDSTLTLNGTGAQLYSDAVTGTTTFSGTLTKADKGSWTIDTDLSGVSGVVIKEGLLQVGADGTQGTIGNVNVADNGTLTFDRSDKTTYNGALSGAGKLEQFSAGTLVLNGKSDGFTGSTTVGDGTLIVGATADDGAVLGGDVGVGANATIGGHGTYSGTATLNPGSTLSPGASIGTVTFGNLDVGAGTTWTFELGKPSSQPDTVPGTSDHVTVEHALTFDGGGTTLDLVDAGGAGPGMYNLVDYGSLTTNGCSFAGGTACVTVGSVPAGTSPFAYTLVNNAAGHEIDLYSTAGLTLNIWAPHGAGASNHDGTWASTSPTWTDPKGVGPGAMQPQPGFAVFAGNPGAVTVDGSVSAGGLQFATNGYTLTGGQLDLVGAPGAPIIRVGNGSKDDASKMATIKTELTGSAGLTKTGAGTLILAGANTYAGGTFVNAGTLEAAANGALGTDGVTVDGATGAAVLDVDTGVQLVNPITLDNGAQLNNRGAIGGSSDTAPVISDMGGAAVLNDGGTITGGFAAVAFSYGGTVSNSKQGAQLTATKAGDAAVGIRGGKGMVANSDGAVIQGPTGAVYLADGGDVTNDGKGSGIRSSGGAAVLVGGAPGAVTNKDGAAISGGGGGVVLWAGGNVANVGAKSSISATGKGSIGVEINKAGSVTNEDGAAITGVSFGVLAAGGSRIINTGDGSRIAASGKGSSGVEFVGSGSVANEDGGTISGGRVGVWLVTGGTIANDAGSTIGDTGKAPGDCWDTGTCAIYAVDASHGTKAFSTGGSVTLTNAGTIKGNVQLDGAAANTVTLDAGGVIDGDLEMGANKGSALTLTGSASDPQIYSKAVTGLTVFAGKLVKSGTGTWIVDNDGLAHAANTTISGGTLQVGTGGTDGSLGTGTLLDNGTLAFDRSDDVHLAAGLTGSGALVQRGNGTLFVNGDDGGFAGTSNIVSGALIVGEAGSAGAALGGVVRVAKDGLLGGIGTVGGLDLSGTLAAGSSALGVLHAKGNVTFEPGSTWQIDVRRDGTSDALDVAGNVHILGGEAVALGKDVNLADWGPKTTYTVLKAGGSIDGTFSKVASNLAFLTPTLAYTPHAIALTLQRNTIDFDAIARTPIQKATADGVQALGFGNPVYDAVVMQDAAGARESFDALSGEIYASARGAQILDTRYVRDAMNGRLVDAAHGTADHAGSIHGTNATFWVHGYGHWDSHGSDGNAAHLRADGSGLLMGVDVPVGNGRVGALLGSSQQSIEDDARGSTAHIESTWLGAYGDTSLGAWHVRGGAAYGSGRMHSTRRIAFPGYAGLVGASPASYRLQAYAEAAWNAGGPIAPYLNVAWAHLSTAGVYEQGNAAALHVSASRDEATFTTLGARGSWHFGAAASGTTLHAGLGWRHAFGSKRFVSQTRFAGQSHAFAVSGLPIAANALAVSVGAELSLARNVHLSFGYDGQLGARTTEQGAHARLTVNF